MLLPDSAEDVLENHFTPVELASSHDFLASSRASNEWFSRDLMAVAALAMRKSGGTGKSGIERVR